MRTNATRQQSDFSPRNQMEQILESQLDQLQRRVLETAKGEFLFDLTGPAKEFLLLTATEEDLSAQRLKLAIESHVVYPLADLFATDQILAGDIVRIDRHQNQPRLTFTIKGKDLASPARLFEPNGFMGYVPAHTGRSAELVGL
jgi:hypothetical protein